MTNDLFGFALGVTLSATGWLLQRHIRRVDALEKAQQAYAIEFERLRAEFREYRREHGNNPSHVRGERAPRT